MDEWGWGEREIVMYWRGSAVNLEFCLDFKVEWDIGASQRIFVKKVVDG